MLNSTVTGNTRATVNTDIAVKSTRTTHSGIGLIIARKRHTSICLVIKRTMVISRITCPADIGVSAGIAVVVTCITKQTIHITIESRRTDIIAIGIIEVRSGVVTVIGIGYEI